MHQGIPLASYLENDSDSVSGTFSFLDRFLMLKDIFVIYLNVALCEPKKLFFARYNIVMWLKSRLTITLI